MLGLVNSSPINNKHFTSVGAYMRAYDRIACQRASEAFQNYNFVIGSYGTGRLVVFLKPSSAELATAIALSEGLIPPRKCLSGHKKQANQETYDSSLPADLKTILEGDYLLAMTKLISHHNADSDLLLKADDIFDNDKAMQLPKLTELLKTVTSTNSTVFL